MSRASRVFGLHDSWSFIPAAVAVAALVVGFVAGFLLLPRYQGLRGPYSVKESAYHALGLHVHEMAITAPQPPLKVPTHIAWTESTVRQATSGDPKRGKLVAADCASCHGEQGLTTEPGTPNLAGLDSLSVYKQLDDYRFGSRLSDVMPAIAQSLTPQQSADVGAYYAALPGLPENSGERMPRPNSSYHNNDSVQRLIFAGDPKRGIAACASCHGPGGYLIGTPALIHQNALYIEQQLQAFAQGTRRNDMNMPMRTIAALLTPAEMQALASAYSKGLVGSN